jgi:PAS domain S-box-containing protein
MDDLDSNILRCSDECYRIFGFEPGTVKVTPATALRFVHPDDRAGFVTSMREALSTGKICTSEHRIVRPDGSVRMVHARGELLRDPAGKLPLRVVGTTQDVTERTEAREEIERLNADLERRVAERTAQLEAANHDLESFAYSASHDLRAPLRAINGYAQILLAEEHAGLGDEAQRSLLRIEQSARRMDGLIDGLLALSRLGRRSPEIEAVDVRQIVDEAIDELGVAGATGIDFSIGELPHCLADPSLLRQVFVNLVGNAVKFSRGRKPARIGVECRVVGGERVWCVRDNGIGFEMREAPRLFGVFQRLPTDESYEGTGLGLAIVDRIVKRHGGRIWVDSAPDQGTTFSFTLDRRP